MCCCSWWCSQFSSFLLKPQCGHRSVADGGECGAVTDPKQVEQYPEKPERFALPLQQARQLSFLAKDIVNWCERGGEEASFLTLPGGKGDWENTVDTFVCPNQS